MDICKVETTDNKDFSFNLPVPPAASYHERKGAGECGRGNRERENESLCYGKRVTVSLMCTVILSQVLGGPRESPNGKIEKQSKTELSRGSVCFFMLHQHVEY